MPGAIQRLFNFGNRPSSLGDLRGEGRNPPPPTGRVTQQTPTGRGLTNAQLTKNLRGVIRPPPDRNRVNLVSDSTKGGTLGLCPSRNFRRRSNSGWRPRTKGDREKGASRPLPSPCQTRPHPRQSHPPSREKRPYSRQSRSPPRQRLPYLRQSHPYLVKNAPYPRQSRPPPCEKRPYPRQRRPIPRQRRSYSTAESPFFLQKAPIQDKVAPPPAHQ